ncbi:MAG: alpha/beta hydrolase [Candidatus Promineifilaceae bacterium]
MPFRPSYAVPASRRAYALEAGPAGVLMLHGFLGSPASSRPLAAYLAGRAISVHCPLLPGHGELPDKLRGVPRQAWLAEAAGALEGLQADHDPIFLMGHSMGAVLSAQLAAGNPAVRGLILLAPALDVPRRAIRLLRFGRHLLPWFYPHWLPRLRPLVYERLRDYDPSLDFADPAVRARLPELSRVPTGAIDEMRRVLDAGRRLWPRLDAPAIVFQGGGDIAVDSATTERLFAALPHPDKAYHYFETAGHELMRPFEPVHAQVWPRIAAFIRRRAGAALVEPAELTPAR